MEEGYSPYRPGRPIVAEVASGAVVVRGRELLLLHEPSEDRWCLPKGHVEAGESLEDAALREVREETGLQDVRLGREIAEVTYRFFSLRKGVNVHKTSIYFLGSSAAGEVVLEKGFDRFLWASFGRARKAIRYQGDRTVLAKAYAATHSRRRGKRPSEEKPREEV
jgi:8-oxo-dGTP pyrophosphatase MutT (NUDIX family)